MVFAKKIMYLVARADCPHSDICMMGGAASSSTHSYLVETSLRHRSGAVAGCLNARLIFRMAIPGRVHFAPSVQTTNVDPCLVRVGLGSVSLDIPFAFLFRLFHFQRTPSSSFASFSCTSVIETIPFPRRLSVASFGSQRLSS